MASNYEKWTLHDDPAILQRIGYHASRDGLADAIQPTTEERMQMFERCAQKNRASSYDDSLTGILEESQLSRVFFSAENVQILQNGLRAGVHRMSNNEIVLPPQNIDHLKIIMRSIFLQFSEFNTNSIRDQVTKLNQIVVDDIVPRLFGEAMGYLKYLEDKSCIRQPLSLPALVDRDFKEMEFTQFF